jgi:TrmH family RNA methyltransferase
LFVAESYRVIKTLIENKIVCRNLLATRDSKYFGEAVRYSKQGITVDEINHKIYESVSSLSTSDGMIAVFVKPNNKFSLETNKKYIVLDRIQNPGNLGTIIRTAVAFNIDGIIITNDSVDLYHPNIVRATMGSLVNMPIKVSTSLMDVIKGCKAKGIKTYATSLNAQAKSLAEVNFSNSSAVIFGNEGQGLNNNDIKACDENIYIPISEKIDSINVSTAASIIMYQLTKK